MANAPKQVHVGPVGFKPYRPAKGEDYMNENQKEHFRHILELWKQQLMEEVDLTKQHMQSDFENYADPVDRASQETDFNLELRTRDRERMLLKKIEKSIDQLDTDDYGFCEDCGAEIGIKRLEARPTATKCIDCKTLQEMKEKNE
ncbi:MAG: RNA polymerase-binding protein DksA [Gammaproteobacteria bacterium RIFOXYB2_FULL_38_6]|nr:MAG: RNA polymerase-binding protein DksA [Gammaproteobacteria bacterium RIFOXYB2_FULL_38_6]